MKNQYYHLKLEKVKHHHSADQIFYAFVVPQDTEVVQHCVFQNLNYQSLDSCSEISSSWKFLATFLGRCGLARVSGISNLP